MRIHVPSDVIIRQVINVPCRKLRWICHKHSDDVARQVETPGKRIIFVARQISFVVGHNFLVASMVTLYHDCKQVKAAIDVFLV